MHICWCMNKVFLGSVTFEMLIGHLSGDVKLYGHLYTAYMHCISISVWYWDID